MTTTAEYPAGSTLVYRDWNRESDQIEEHRSAINGTPIYDDDQNLVAIPVWAESASTTVYVVAGNVVGVEK